MGQAKAFASQRPCDEHLTHLLALARGGDIPAFEDFYALTIRHVVPVARRICGRSLGDDALADAYFQVWQAVQAFDPARGGPLAWLTVIVQSRSRDVMRKERLRQAGCDEAAFDAAQQACPGAGPQDAAEILQQHAALSRAMRTLPVAQKLLINLSYFHDRSHTEMATETGLPLGTVKTMMRKSHHQLRKLLTQEA